MRQPRVALVNPPHSLEERYGSLKGVGNTMPSLGLAGLAAILRDAGFAVAVIDAPSRQLGYAEAVTETEAFAPDAVGMTAFTPSIFNAATMAGILKDRHPARPIVLGGPHLSALPADTLRRFPAFDLGVVGEADDTIVPVFRALLDGGRPEDLPGLVLRRGEAFAETARPAPIRDLDRLPFPAWDLLPGFPGRVRPAAHTYRRLPAATLFTARGCPELCVFCDRSVFGNAVRAFSAEYVVNQMELLVRRFGIRDLTIYDDIFPLAKPRLLRICELIRERGLDLTWSCNSRVNYADPEALRAMKAAGCWQIGYGIESGDQALLDRIAKRTKLPDIERAVRLTDEAGIRVKGFFMMGLPGETPETIQRTIDFACRLSLSDYQTCFFTPLPGTAATVDLPRWGTLDDDWRKMNLLNPVFVPHGFTAEGLGDWAARSYRAFYLRPRIVWRYLTRIRRLEHVVQMCRGGLVLLASLARGRARSPAQGLQ
jgi:radical SAM superfamily enzyme YgiQ (UPF0313 family)